MTPQASQTVRSRSALDGYDLAIVLGSGFDFIPEDFRVQAKIDYADLPGLPETTVSGHTGQLLCGETDSLRILIFQGRFHLYEGLTAKESTAHIRLAAELGCTQVILTSAVGGINPRYRTGDFTWITDHLNLTGDNPLTGIRNEPFVDLSTLYSQSSYPQLHNRLHKEHITLHQGTLAVMRGPSYETPAEIRMLRTLGADVVGMSVAPEAIMAKYLNMRIMAISRITNPAAGLGPTPLSHTDVLSVAKDGQSAANRLLNLLLKQLQGPPKHPLTTHNPLE